MKQKQTNHPALLASAFPWRQLPRQQSIAGRRFTEIYCECATTYGRLQLAECL